MMDIAILGNGQIWDIRGVNPEDPDQHFEDLFSGRALGHMARSVENGSSQHVFSSLVTDGSQIEGTTVTEALMAGDQPQQAAAVQLLTNLGQSAARGIKALTLGEAWKPEWTDQQREQWKGLKVVIVGAGVSEGRTGEVLVEVIRESLKADGLWRIQILQAPFPGKEAGYLGAVAYVIPWVMRDAEGPEPCAVVGLDLGRQDLGVGLLRVHTASGKVLGMEEIAGDIVDDTASSAIFERSIPTYDRAALEPFIDADRTLTPEEQEQAESIRADIVGKLALLAVDALQKAHEHGLASAHHIGLATPGEVDEDGALIGSTPYLPLFRQQDGFSLSEAVSSQLEVLGFSGFQVHLLNDGIAAGLANLRFGLTGDDLREGKYAFLGPGSGLGGGLFYLKPEE